MRLGICIAVLTLALLSLEGLARSANWLEGQVLENYGRTKRPAAGVEVSIVNVGNPYRTGPDGGYRVLVPDAIRVGQTIGLYVKHNGWTIDTPIGGKLKLSNSLKQDIVLLPEYYSSRFLSTTHIQMLIESMPEEMRNQVKRGGKPGDTDPTLVFKQYSTKHRLSEIDVFERVEAVVRQYEESEEPYNRCLALIYRKNFDQAASTCHRAATSKIDLLKQKQQEIATLLKSLRRSEYPLNRGPIIAGIERAWPSAPSGKNYRFAIPVWNAANTVAWTQLITSDSSPKSLLMQLAVC